MAERDFIPTYTDVPAHVSEAEYHAYYAERYYEYVEGMLIKLSPVELGHMRLTAYLYALADEFLIVTELGEVFQAPFPLRLSTSGRHYREPDLFILLNAHRHLLHRTYTEFADVCIEVISPESRQRDTETKFREYQQLGIPEYWVFDLEAQRAVFYRLDAEGVYQSVTTAGDAYTTPLLPRFQLHVPTLWRDRRPISSDIAHSVAAMLNTSET